MKALDFDWNKAKSFLIVAEQGTYLAASKILKVAQPTLGRQVAALEQELGVALFEKVGKGLELTPSGIELLDHVRKMAEAANQLALSASGKSLDIEGHVCISASEAYAAYLLPEILMKLRKIQPKIKIDIIASNETSDLRKREADIAIRNYKPQHTNLIAKKINDDQFFFYASPKYLKQFGYPKKKSDLNNAAFIGFSENSNVISELNRHGLQLSEENFPFTMSSHYAHWEMVKKGAAIGFMEKTIGDRESKVQRVLPELFTNMKVENWLVSHRDLKNSRRIRVVFDFLYEELVDTLSA